MAAGLAVSGFPAAAFRRISPSSPASARALSPATTVTARPPLSAYYRRTEVGLTAPQSCRPAATGTKSRAVALAASTRETSGLLIEYTQVEVVTQPGVALFDITPQIKALLAVLGATEGVVHVLSRHTTTAVVINEMEGRLVDDVRQFLPKLVPPGEPYLHNDIHLRDGPPDWPGGNAAWRAQEPVNAHSHLQAMLLGQSETVPVHQGELVLGTWQSVILVELDGTEGRVRTVGLQFMGRGRPT